MSTTPLYPANKQPLGVRFRRAMTRWWPLYLMLLPGIIYFLVYKYAPMYGLVIAFKKFSIKKGILGSPWVTPWYKYFEQFFSSPANRNVIKNTITLSLWKLAVGLFPSLIFALAVSECRNRFFAASCRPSVTCPTSSAGLLCTVSAWLCCRRATALSIPSLKRWAAPPFPL